MPKERLELSWGHPRAILSRVRLPFRHFGKEPLARLLGLRNVTRQTPLFQPFWLAQDFLHQDRAL